MLSGSECLLLPTHLKHLHLLYFIVRNILVMTIIKFKVCTCMCSVKLKTGKCFSNEMSEHFNDIQVFLEILGLHRKSTFTNYSVYSMSPVLIYCRSKDRQETVLYVAYLLYFLNIILD